MGKKSKTKRGRYTGRAACVPCSTPCLPATPQLVIDNSPENEGLGLFAVGDIHRGAIVARFPLVVSTETYGDYVFPAHDGTVLYTGSPWTGPVPSQPFDLGGPVAHLLNDPGIMRQHARWPGLVQFLLDLGEYALLCVNGNVGKDGDSLDYKAIRDIAAGDELTCAYGWQWWTRRYLAPAQVEFCAVMSQLVSTVLRHPCLRVQWGELVELVLDEGLADRARLFLKHVLCMPFQRLPALQRDCFSRHVDVILDLLMMEGSEEAALLLGGAYGEYSVYRSEAMGVPP
jgi:hypothetical protein